MHIRMSNLERLTVAEMEEFVSSNRGIDCSVIEGAAAYGFIERVLTAQRYRKLIRRWVDQRQPARRPSFPRRYTDAGIALLAEVDAAHEDLSGPAVRHLLERAWLVFGDPRCERLATISVSHIYNLRRSAAYRRRRVRVQPTQARRVSIAERRLPEPRGRPGYLRVDTVHQGQHDGRPGVYHITSTPSDTVTQWEVVGCVATICERDLIPVLEAMLHQFPFRILGFHCDNGSEFLNRQVVRLLNKLLVEEFTKSRAYRTTDNALVEGKNGAVVRKLIGYGAIGAEHAAAFQRFYTAQFNPYLNFHRPCGFATLTTNRRGKQKRTYRHQDYRTPYEKLTSLPNWQQYLKPGITPALLQRQAPRHSDTEAARRMQQAKLALLTQCRSAR